MTVPIRTVDAGRLGLGVLALARPRTLLAATRTSDLAPATRRVTRVLGARWLLQAAAGPLLRRRTTPRTAARLNASVDLTHAVSMLGLAGLSRQHRRAALLSAAVAGGFAGVDLSGRAR